MNYDENENSHSITMDLENLRQKYSNLLIQYKGAVADYVNYLNIQSQQPCGNFTANSKGIDQACYNHIWKKSGCGTGTIQPAPDANDRWAKAQTLNDIIHDSWLWATLTDTTRRKGCYGNSTNYNKSSAPNYKINNEPLVSIKGQAFNGTGSAGQSSATTLQDCIASCASSNTCTGATFISNKCQLRIGDSPIVPSTQDSYAIIPKEKQLLLNMEDINQQLLDVNEELVNKIKVSEPVYDKINADTTSKNQELIKNYESLLEERRNITKILNEYETLDNTENEAEIKISQNYNSYILLFILAFVIGFLLYKMFGSGNINSLQAPTSAIQYGGDIGVNAYYMVFGLIIFIIILNFSMKHLTLFTPLKI